MSDLADVLRRRLEVTIGTPFTEGNKVESCATATGSSPRCSKRSAARSPPSTS